MRGHYKTCVSVAESTPARLVHVLSDKALKKADYAEARLDYLEPELVPDALDLLKDYMSRIICTVRPVSQGGMFADDADDERISILKLAAEYGPFLLDVELDTLRSSESLTSYLKSTNNTTILASWHDFGHTPSTATLNNMIAQMSTYSAYSKIVCMARSPADSARMLGLYAHKDPRMRLISFAMGEHGMLSRILCLSLGSPYTYASLATASAVAPGQIAIDEVNRIIGAKTKQK